MELFDIVKNIFSKNQRSWDSVGKNDKVRNFFMINRIMAIQFPVQANQFNKMRVTPHFVVDWWRNTLSNRFSKPPSWIYIKTLKKEAVGKKTKSSDYSEIENFICDRYKISRRDLSQIKEFYPDKYNDWMIDVSDQLGLKK